MYLSLRGPQACVLGVPVTSLDKWEEGCVSKGIRCEICVRIKRAGVSSVVTPQEQSKVPPSSFKDFTSGIFDVHIVMSGHGRMHCNTSWHITATGTVWPLLAFIQK